MAGKRTKESMERTLTSMTDFTAPVESSFVCGCRMKPTIVVDSLDVSHPPACVSCRLVDYCNKMGSKSADIIYKTLEMLHEEKELDVVQERRLWSTIYLAASKELEERAEPVNY